MAGDRDRARGGAGNARRGAGVDLAQARDRRGRVAARSDAGGAGPSGRDVAGRGHRGGAVIGVGDDPHGLVAVGIHRPRRHIDIACPRGGGDAERVYALGGAGGAVDRGVAAEGVSQDAGRIVADGRGRVAGDRDVARARIEGRDGVRAAQEARGARAVGGDVPGRIDRDVPRAACADGDANGVETTDIDTGARCLGDSDRARSRGCRDTKGAGAYGGDDPISKIHGHAADRSLRDDGVRRSA